MNAVQTVFNSPRFNRYLLWLGVVVLAAGALTLVLTLVGGSDTRQANPSPGFHAKLPTPEHPLTNATGARVRTFEQLDPQVRTTIHKFIETAVARRHLDASWTIVAPTLKQGYTRNQWMHAQGLPIVPYPDVDTKHINFYLDTASTDEILVEVGLSGLPGAKSRPTTFQIGLSPAGTGSAKHWLVDYWMPRWTPPVPAN
jgi:hypothetical protein